jgi:hypothetical protein
VLDPAHQAAALALKNKAVGGTAQSRLEAAAPESKILIERAFQLGESPRSQAAELTKLLQRHGADRLRRAIAEAMQRETPRACSVAFLLSQWERQAEHPAEVDLSRHPQFQSLYIRPHALETYDALAYPNQKTSPEEQNHDPKAE